MDVPRWIFEMAWWRAMSPAAKLLTIDAMRATCIQYTKVDWRKSYAIRFTARESKAGLTDAHFRKVRRELVSRGVLTRHAKEFLKADGTRACWRDYFTLSLGK